MHMTISKPPHSALPATCRANVLPSKASYIHLQHLAINPNVLAADVDSSHAPVLLTCTAGLVGPSLCLQQQRLRRSWELQLPGGR